MDCMEDMSASVTQMREAQQQDFEQFYIQQPDYKFCYANICRHSVFCVQSSIQVSFQIVVAVRAFFPRCIKIEARYCSLDIVYFCGTTLLADDDELLNHAWI